MLSDTNFTSGVEGVYVRRSQTDSLFILHVERCLFEGLSTRAAYVEVLSPLADPDRAPPFVFRDNTVTSCSQVGIMYSARASSGICREQIAKYSRPSPFHFTDTAIFLPPNPAANLSLPRQTFLEAAILWKS